MTENTKQASEDQEQAAVVAWCRAQARARPGLEHIVHVPNYRRLTGSGRQRAAQVARLRALGFADGYPDLLLDLPRGKYHGLRIELKARRKGVRATPAQRAWLERLLAAGYAALVCHGADHAVTVITMYYDQGEP